MTTASQSIPAELGAEPAAKAYAPVVRDALPFDLVHLGMGEDGHTASLFPGHSHQGDALVHPVHDAPKPPPDRVTLSERALNDARGVYIIVTGEAKCDAVRAWRSGELLPVARIHGHSGADVFLDEAAAS